MTSQRTNRLIVVDGDDGHRHTVVDTGAASTMTRRSTKTGLFIELPGKAKPKGISTCALFAWALTLVLILALLVASFVVPAWISGSEIVDGTVAYRVGREVGPFVQCNTIEGQAQNCFATGITNSGVTAWRVSAFLFGLGAAIIVAMIVLVALSAFYQPQSYALKVVMTVDCFVFLIAVLLIPLGFIYLDDDCRDGVTGACGLRCNDPTRGMGYFSLCAPYTVDTGVNLMFAALVIFYLSALFTRLI